MAKFRAYVARHHVGLLALLLILTGGVSYAAGALPKNSVKSKQVKNNSLTGKDIKNKSVKGLDLKDGSVTGADLADGSVTGADLKNGAVGMPDIAPGAVDEVRVFSISDADGIVTLFDEEGIGKITFGIDCSSSITINAFASSGLSPARAGAYGIEHRQAPSEADNNSPLIGASTLNHTNDVGQPTGGAGFGGGPFGFGDVVLFTQSSTKDVHVTIQTSFCTARAVVAIDNKPAGSTLTRPSVGSKAEPTQAGVVCEATGAAYCTEPKA